MHNSFIPTRRRRDAEHEVELHAELTATSETEASDGGATNKELIDRANKRVLVANERLQEAHAGIDARIGDRESQALMQSQKE
jgi:hypothetical protein